MSKQNKYLSYKENIMNITDKDKESILIKQGLNTIIEINKKVFTIGTHLLSLPNRNKIDIPTKKITRWTIYVMQFPIQNVEDIVANSKIEDTKILSLIEFITDTVNTYNTYKSKRECKKIKIRNSDDVSITYKPNSIGRGAYYKILFRDILILS